MNKMSTLVRFSAFIASLILLFLLTYCAPPTGYNEADVLGNSEILEDPPTACKPLQARWWALWTYKDIVLELENMEMGVPIRHVVKLVLYDGKIYKCTYDITFQTKTFTVEGVIRETNLCLNFEGTYTYVKTCHNLVACDQNGLCRGYW